MKNQNYLKRAISGLAKRLGYTIIRTDRVSDFSMANKLRDIFALFSIERVIDVGANEGQFHDFLRTEVGFEGRIESFEPIPELAERLKSRAARADPKWSIHASALGAEAGALNINIMAGSVFSSFHTPIPNGDYTQRAMNTVVGTAIVPVTTLDAEFGGNGTNLQRVYLKLDTQGFDLEVLRGAKRVISAIPALQTELSFQPFYSNMPDYKTAIAAFESHGFAVADMFLVCTDDMCRAMEFDCVMIRDAGSRRESLKEPDAKILLSAVC